MCRNKGSHLLARETVTRLSCTVGSPLSIVLFHVYYTFDSYFISFSLSINPVCNCTEPYVHRYNIAVSSYIIDANVEGGHT